jgi:hypothetical protein
MISSRSFFLEGEFFSCFDPRKMLANILVTTEYMIMNHD